MLRIVLGVIAGFITWSLAWFGGEHVLSAIGPAWFGAPQRAFQSAIEHGGQFTADTTLLLIHIVLGVVVTVLAGFVAALVASENKRAPIALGCLLLAMGVMKMVMSWPYVPLWYHIVFTALLLPLAIAGGKLRASASKVR